MSVDASSKTGWAWHRFVNDTTRAEQHGPFSIATKTVAAKPHGPSQPNSQRKTTSPGSNGWAALRLTGSLKLSPVTTRKSHPLTATVLDHIDRLRGVQPDTKADYRAKAHGLADSRHW